MDYYVVLLNSIYLKRLFLLRDGRYINYNCFLFPTTPKPTAAQKKPFTPPPRYRISGSHSLTPDIILSDLTSGLCFCKVHGKIASSLLRSRITNYFSHLT